MSKPLVSIPIVTYNSAEFIIETLESVKAHIQKSKAYRLGKMLLNPFKLVK